MGVAAGTTNADLDNPATLATPIQGAFGKLTLAADGSYSYTRDPGTAGGVNDVFTYTIKDGDGDLSHTTLTISIGNSPPTITNLTPAAGGGDVTVNEDDLLASRGAGESAGSDTSKESLTQTGTFTVSSPDGIKSLTIDGHTVISNGVFTATSFTTSTLSNTLSVTGYNAATGVVSYSYTLLDNETHAAGAGTNSLFENLAVVLTDQDNQTANDTLVANIIDDVPTAVADIDSVAAGTPGPATGNVLTGGTDAIDSNTTDGVADVQGADGAVVVGGAAGTTNADLDNPATLATPIQGAFGKLTLAADGSYSYTRDPGTAGGVSDVFTYTIKDGDGDLSHTTLTISIGNSPPTITDLTPAAGGGDVTVNEDDLLASRGAGEFGGLGHQQGEPDADRDVHGLVAGWDQVADDRRAHGDQQRCVHGDVVYDVYAGQHAVGDGLQRRDRRRELQLHAAGQRDACGWGGHQQPVREPRGGSDRPGQPDGQRHAGCHHHRRRSDGGGRH